MAHVNDGVWDNHTPGIWYGELIIERPNGETDYVYAYSNVRDDAPDISLILPEGCTELSRTLLLTSHGKWELRDDQWAFEAQCGGEGTEVQSHDAYWDAGLRAE